MLTKRIIPCLDVKDGRTVKGTKFVNLRDAGDPVELASRYSDEGADELVFLDISASREERKTFLTVVERVARAIQIPFTVGGGISTVDDVLRALDAGADKVSLNTAIVEQPEFLQRASAAVGSQSIVAAIDAKRKGSGWNVWTKGGSEETALRCSCLDSGGGPTGSRRTPDNIHGCRWHERGYDSRPSSNNFVVRKRSCDCLGGRGNTGAH